MGSSYHQFCPVAKAMELLDERWTLIVIRELSSACSVVIIPMPGS
jgi:DNA-binding HxlR family transcriptional regulator